MIFYSVWRKNRLFESPNCAYEVVVALHTEYYPEYFSRIMNVTCILFFSYYYLTFISNK